MRKSAFGYAWLLLGVLALAAVLISLGKQETITNPQVDSFGPSGLSAFADLLRSNGYEVATATGATLNLRAGDVALACLNRGSKVSISDDSAGVFGALARFVAKGGRLIALPFSTDISDSVFDLKAVNSISNERKNLKAARTDIESVEAMLPSDVTQANLWLTDDASEDTIASLMRYQKGTILETVDGFMASNRQIDKAQNADLMMNLVKTIAPAGSRIVFTEATFSEEEAGLIGVLGPGATAAWYQAIFLFVVVIFTLGKRFGLPEEVRPSQTGQRDLVDAVADTYRRAKATRIAARAAYDSADFEIRKALKLPSDAPALKRDANLPPELALAFRRVFEASVDSLSPKDAFERCQALKKQVRAFLHRS